MWMTHNDNYGPNIMIKTIDYWLQNLTECWIKWKTSLLVLLVPISSYQQARSRVQWPVHHSKLKTWLFKCMRSISTTSIKTLFILASEESWQASWTSWYESPVITDYCGEAVYWNIFDNLCTAEVIFNSQKIFLLRFKLGTWEGKSRIFF